MAISRQKGYIFQGTAVDAANVYQEIATAFGLAMTVVWAGWRMGRCRLVVDTVSAPNSLNQRIHIPVPVILSEAEGSAHRSDP